MSKNRNVRQPILENGEKLNKNVRKGIGPQLKMDMSRYIEQYPNKRLMLINDLDGDVQRWLDAGAEPIPAQLPDRKIYAGLNDKAPSDWVRFVGGQTTAGETYYAYGLMMDPELYDEYKHAPMRQRQDDIKQAMGTGKTEESGSLPGGGNVQTYAANLPTGSGQGFNQIRSK